MIALGLLVLRLVLAVILVGHGAQKLFGWWGGPGMTGWTGAMTRMRIRPAVPWAWMSALAEFVGGLLVGLGFLNPLGSFAIAGSMLVALILVHWPKGFWVSKGGYEFNLMILGAAAAVAIAGPGAYSLDTALGIRLPEPWLLILGALATVAGVAVAVGTRVPADVAKAQPA